MSQLNLKNIGVVLPQQISAYNMVNTLAERPSSSKIEKIKSFETVKQSTKNFTNIESKKKLLTTPKSSRKFERRVLRRQVKKVKHIADYSKNLKNNVTTVKKINDEKEQRTFNYETCLNINDLIFNKSQKENAQLNLNTFDLFTLHNSVDNSTKQTFSSSNSNCKNFENNLTSVSSTLTVKKHQSYNSELFEKLLIAFENSKKSTENPTNIFEKTKYSESLNNTSNAKNIFSTPVRHKKYNRNLRRQKSASATLSDENLLSNILYSTKNSVSTSRFTPSSTKEMMSPIFAASKFLESPLTTNIPMPPTEWINDLESRLKEKSVNNEVKLYNKNLMFTYLNRLSIKDDEVDSDSDLKTDIDSVISSISASEIESSILASLKKNEKAKNNKISSFESVDNGSSSGFGEGSLSDFDNFSESESLKIFSPVKNKNEDCEILQKGIRMDPLVLIAAVNASTI